MEAAANTAEKCLGFGTHLVPAWWRGGRLWDSGKGACTEAGAGVLVAPTEAARVGPIASHL